MIPFFGNVIGGTTRPGVDGARLTSVDPVTGEPWAEAADSGAADVDDACAAAVEAFRGWRRTTPRDRMDALLAAADLLAAHADELAALEVRDTGKPRLAGNDLQPGDRRAPGKRQVPQAAGCEIFLLEAERDRAAHQHDVWHRLAQVTAEGVQRAVPRRCCRHLQPAAEAHGGESAGDQDNRRGSTALYQPSNGRQFSLIPRTENK